MFCFQCEQTAFSKGCTIRGVCGKKEETADLQDELINSLVKMAKCKKNQKDDKTTRLILDGLFACVTNVNFDNDSIKKMIEKIKNELNCEAEFDVKNIWNNENEDIRSLKSLILFGIKGMSAYAHHARVLGYKNEKIDEFFYEALNALIEINDIDKLFSFVLKTGEINLETMELLDKANTESYGNPIPQKVTTNIEPGPFIVITGHDLRDLSLLLEQTKDKGINIYTHGEMLPAHAYPELKKYSHLKGNFGTAWQNQQKEFDNLPAPVLFTTNCIMPPKESYKDRVFATSVVSYPECKYIDENKDFSPIIEKALELKGFKEAQKRTGINNGDVLTVGFAHNTVFENAQKIISLINQGKINHIFLIGGCDGAKPGRNYYTEFAKQTPKNSLILTLACGKYRFNDLDLGEIEGIPRILDMGQCNDAFSAIKVALELSKALNCPVNNLPLSFILSWYEQKAVAILLTLFYLEIENIRLGPTLPAFVSPNILNILVEKYKIKPITTPKQDLDEILGK